MMHKAWSSIEEVPYCFSRSSVKFQGHTALKIVEFYPNWAFPDSNSSLNSRMAMKCCTKFETAKERCPIVFQRHPSNFKVTRDKTSPILTQIGCFRTISRSQLSNPSDLPCSRSYVKFQGHTAVKIVEFDPNWAFPDFNSSLNSSMAMKCCTKLETAKERCPIVFQGHPSNFKVTRYKTSPILTQIGRFRIIGWWQLSNPSDLPCFRSCIKFQGHTGWKIDDLDKIWARLPGRSQLSNPSDLPCSRSSAKFQGQTAEKIVEFDPDWAFPDFNSSLNSPMAMKWCTKLEVA